MPGLLDLPPELIEQIHIARERLFSAEGEFEETDIAVAPDTGSFRLVNRYIERATRRAFVEKYFALWCIKEPSDAEIQKFCDMASTPDLAAAIQELDILVDDDYTMVVQGTKSSKHLTTQEVHKDTQGVNLQLDDEHFKQVRGPSHSMSLEVRATHAFDSITGALVPAAYLRHRLALIEAFRACKNVVELWIGNRPLEHDRVRRYKRSSQGGERHNEHGHDHRVILSDVTLSYNYVLHLAAEAGMCPEKIIPFHECSEIICSRTRVGLTDCAGLVRSKEALKRLMHLNLGFVRDQQIPQGHRFEQCGIRLGKQIVEAFAYMPVLNRLRVDFELADSVAAWSVLAQAPAIPTLKELFLETCIVNMNDFASFVGKHCSTWTSMTISHMHICNGTKAELGDLYKRLSQAPNIEVYRQRLFFLGAHHDGHIDVPSQVSCPILDGVEDEDGFVTVYQTDWVRWKGHDEVVRVLGVMAEYMRS